MALISSEANALSREWGCIFLSLCRESAITQSHQQCNSSSCDFLNDVGVQEYLIEEHTHSYSTLVCWLEIRCSLMS